MMQNIYTMLARIIMILPAFLIALSFHECAHALMATLLGDDTPKRMGRLTLNPLAHIDPMGMFFLLVFRIGWAKPVIFDNRNFKYPRLYAILTAFAGPTSNFILALVCLYLIKYVPFNLLPGAVAITLTQIIKTTAYINIMLGVFNFLPLPPLDGSHIITAFLMDQFPMVVAWINRYSMFLLLGLFLLPQTRVGLMYLITKMEYFLNLLVI